MLILRWWFGDASQSSSLSSYYGTKPRKFEFDRMTTFDELGYWKHPHELSSPAVWQPWLDGIHKSCGKPVVVGVYQQVGKRRMWLGTPSVRFLVIHPEVNRSKGDEEEPHDG